MKALTLLIIALFALTACASEPAAQSEPVKAPEKADEPENTPAPVAQVKETQPASAPEPTEAPPEPKKTIDPEIQEILDKKTKVKSLYYKHKGPDTGTDVFETWQIEHQVKYSPFISSTVSELDVFDMIYLDTKQETAASYCEHRKCVTKGKYQDESYSERYFPNPLTWLEGVTQAEKITEEKIERRATWKIQTNNGILWIDTFYGIPLRAEVDGVKYTYEEIDINGGITTNDVTPPAE